MNHSFLSYFNQAKSLLNRNVAIATTFKILLFSLLIALIISISSFYFIQHHQTKNIHTSIKELANTVEKTASIATFTNDTELAKEVVEGLQGNKVVSGVRIISEKKVLISLGESSQTDLNVYKKSLFSPFDPTQEIGVLQININSDEIFQQSYVYAKFISIILFALIITIAVSLSFAIHLNIIKPIKRIGDKLHNMDAQHLHAIATPQQHEHDEIGRLVADINALTQQQKALLRSEKTLRLQQEIAQKRTQLIFEKNKNGLFIADYQLNLSIWNTALEKILSINTAFAHPNLQLNLKTILKAHESALQNLLTNVLQHQRTENLVLNLDGGQTGQWVEVTFQVLDEHSLQGIISDVSNHKKLEMLALAIAEHDALTGLLNRRGFEFKLVELIQSCSPESSMALLLIDLDGFKYVNDHFGHHAGDFVLSTASRRLESILRSHDALARLGGDEFVVILSHLKNANNAETIANKIIELISLPMTFESNTFNVGASIGIATNNQPYQNQALLLKQADSAMYQAKKAGKGRFYVYRDTITL